MPSMDSVFSSLSIDHLDHRDASSQGQGVTDTERSRKSKAWQRNSVPAAAVTDIARARSEFQQEARQMGVAPNPLGFMSRFNAAFKVVRTDAKVMMRQYRMALRKAEFLEEGMSGMRSRPSEEDEDEEKVGEGDTMLNIISAIVGGSLLVQPWAFGELGWSCVLWCWALGGIMGYTAILLAWSAEKTVQLNKRVKVVTFSAMAYVAFGRWGERFVRIIATLELSFVMVNYLAINVTSFEAFTATVTKREDAIPAVWFFAGQAVFTMLLLTRPPTYLAWFSTLGLGAVLLTFATVVWTGVKMPEIAAPREVARPFETATIGILLFSFSCHTAVPSMYELMEKKARFPCVAATGFFIGSTVFAIFGAVAWYIFGEDVQENVLKNIGHDLQLEVLPGATGYLNTVGSILFALKLLLTFPLFTYPLVDVCLELLPQSCSEGDTTNVTNVLKVVLVIIASVLAMLMKQATGSIDKMIEIAALTTSLPTAILFPVLIYWKLHQGELSVLSRLFLLLLICGCGTIAGIKGWEEVDKFFEA